MLAGIPIVAADIDGLVEVTGDCARIFRARQRGPLAAAILALAADPKAGAAMATRALDRAQRLFTKERMVEETAAVYESLIQVTPAHDAVSRRR